MPTALCVWDPRTSPMDPEPQAGNDQQPSCSSIASCRCHTQHHSGVTRPLALFLCNQKAGNRVDSIIRRKA